MIQHNLVTYHDGGQAQLESFDSEYSLSGFSAPRVYLSDSTVPQGDVPPLLIFGRTVRPSKQFGNATGADDDVSSPVIRAYDGPYKRCCHSPSDGSGPRLVVTQEIIQVVAAGRLDALL
jgi:hypothetical protein